MWGAWDLALELSLSQLPRILTQVDPASAYRPSPFFEEQLTSFQVWLNLGSVKRAPPEQLPIVLQVMDVNSILAVNRDKFSILFAFVFNYDVFYALSCAVLKHVST